MSLKVTQRSSELPLFEAQSLLIQSVAAQGRQDRQVITGHCSEYRSWSVRGHLYTAMHPEPAHSLR